MTLDEKLDNFYNAAIASATEQSVTIINEYEHSLQKIFEERKQEALKKAESSYRIEVDHLIREKNRKLSSVTIERKRIVLDKKMELTDLLFQDLENKLENFMKTEEYEDLLCEQITAAFQFARGDKVTIYINSSDKDRKATLESRTGVSLTVSDRDFLGGTRAVIHTDHILIDRSFLTKLTEVKSSFNLLNAK